MGMTRFGSAWCWPLQQLGESCRPASQRPITALNLTYPGGVKLVLTDVYQVQDSTPVSGLSTVFCTTF